MDGRQDISARRVLQDNLRRVRERIAQACSRAGRRPDSITLVAVTKSVGVDVIRIALDIGLTDLGENRVQDLVRRAAMVEESRRRQALRESGDHDRPPTWHMIGHLQRNKASAVLQWSRVIHSLDSLRLAEHLSAAVCKAGTVVDVFVQVNASEEQAKHGVAVADAGRLAEQVVTLPGLRLVGLMTMAPLVEDPEQARPVFRRLRALAEELNHRGAAGEHCRALSMGMTNDFEVAIEEGATCLRIGSAIFRRLTSSPP